jgi:nicotinate-nucleotide adenylyltransferase
VRLGLFGGTFDPPHVGHLIVAADAANELGLDAVVFIPAARQPLKTDRLPAPAEARLEMVRRTVSGEPRLRYDSIEIDRAGLSFSVDTLAEYARRHPDAERYFLLGADALMTLPYWREPARVATLARLAVMPRTVDAGATAPATAAPEWEGQGDATARLRSVAPDAPAPVFLSSRRVDVSSTEVRERVRTGRSIRGFVTEGVARYIEASGLYR